MSRTIQQLVVQVHHAVTDEGMDLAPSDVGHIISLFLEGLVHSGPSIGPLDQMLQHIADECSSVK